MPIGAVPVHRLIRYAPDRIRLRSTRKGSSGSVLRASITPNTASSTAAAASAATTLASPQCERPSGVVAALDSPYTRAAIPAVAVIAPGRSNRPARRPVVGSSRVARAATASPIGTLTNITHRQDR
jgi:hypothetical protein